MENEAILPLVANTIPVPVKKEEGCCGGAAVSNADACCKLDEEKKAEGESGCGCNANENSKKKASCCS